MSEISTKPYLLRAIYEWCTDNGYTPYIAAVVDARTDVPMQFVKNGEIVLNISFEATSGLKLDNDSVHFSARFGGVARNVMVPVANVIAIYARENGQGMAFEAPPRLEDVPAPAPGTEPAVPALASVPSAPPSGALDKPAVEPEDEPDPPKKGSRPTLTRIK